jgi:hypothetical protein
MRDRSGRAIKGVVSGPTTVFEEESERISHEAWKALAGLRSRGSLRALRVLASPGLCNPTRPSVHQDSAAEPSAPGGRTGEARSGFCGGTIRTEETSVTELRSVLVVFAAQ